MLSVVEASHGCFFKVYPAKKGKNPGSTPGPLPNVTK